MSFRHILATDDNVQFQNFIVSAHDINDFDSKDGTFLHIVLHLSRNIDMIEFLLSQKANVNTLNPHQEHPIFIAIKKRHLVKVIRLLVDAKSNINIVDKNGQTPLICAIQQYRQTQRQDCFDVIRYLIDEKADVKGSHRHLATMQENANVSVLNSHLIQAKVNPDETERWRLRCGGTVLDVNQLLPSTRVQLREIILQKQKDMSSSSLQFLIRYSVFVREYKDKRKWHLRTIFKVDIGGGCLENIKVSRSEFNDGLPCHLDCNVTCYKPSRSKYSTTSFVLHDVEEPDGEHLFVSSLFSSSSQEREDREFFKGSCSLGKEQSFTVFDEKTFVEKTFRIHSEYPCLPFPIAGGHILLFRMILEFL